MLIQTVPRPTNWRTKPALPLSPNITHSVACSLFKSNPLRQHDAGRNIFLSGKIPIICQFDDNPVWPVDNRRATYLFQQCWKGRQTPTTPQRASFRESRCAVSVSEPVSVIHFSRTVQRTPKRLSAGRSCIMFK